MITIFGNNDVPDGYFYEAYFELFSPSNQLLYTDTTTSFSINQFIQIDRNLPAGIYIIRISLPPTPSELQCCFSLNYQFSFPDDIPIPISTASGMFNFRIDEGYHSLRNVDISTLQFGSYLIENTKYTLQHEPWGDIDIIKNVTVIDPSGNSEELFGSLIFEFTALQTGYYGIEFEMDVFSQNARHRMWALRLMEGSTATKDSIIPMYPVHVPENSGGDVDGDLILDHLEPTNYRNPDIDDDGIKDGVELLIGTNFMDQLDYPISIEAKIIRASDEFIYEFSFFPTRGDLIDFIEFDLFINGEYELAQLSEPLNGVLYPDESKDVSFKSTINLLIKHPPLGLTYHLGSDSNITSGITSEFLYTLNVLDEIPIGISFSSNSETVDLTTTPETNLSETSSPLVGTDLLSFQTPIIYLSLIVTLIVGKKKR